MSRIADEVRLIVSVYDNVVVPGFIQIVTRLHHITNPEPGFAEIEEVRSQSPDDVFCNLPGQLLKDEAGYKGSQMTVEAVAEVLLALWGLQVLETHQHFGDDDDDHGDSTGDETSGCFGDGVILKANEGG
jgi:hypothetical protein